MTNLTEKILAEIERAEEFFRQDVLRALEVLGSIDEEQVTQLDDSATTRYFHIYSKCFHRRDRYAEARQKIQCAVNSSRGLENHKLRATVRYTHGLILRDLGLLGLAGEEFEEAHDTFRTLDDSISLIATLNALASLRYMTGEIEVAVELLREKIAICGEHDLHKEMVSGKLNLARMLATAGRPHEAVAELESIDIEREQTENHVKQIHGTVQTMMLLSSEARRLLVSAADYFGREDEQLDQVVCLERLGENECLSGNCAKAIEIYDGILSRKDMAAGVQSQTLRLKTDALIAEDRFREAVSVARRAERAIVKINERIELGALYRAYGQICTHRGQLHTAREYYESAIRVLRDCGAMYEVAVTYYTCGKSDAFSERDRFAFLAESVDLFTEMESPNWIVRVHEAKEGLSKRLRGEPSVITPATRLPIFNVGVTARKASVLGFTLLGFCIAAIVFSLIAAEGVTGLSIVFASGVLAYQAVVIVRGAKDMERDRNEQTEFFASLLKGPQS